MLSPIWKVASQKYREKHKTLYVYTSKYLKLPLESFNSLTVLIPGLTSKTFINYQVSLSCYCSLSVSQEHFFIKWLSYQEGIYCYKSLSTRLSRNIFFFFVKTYYNALVPTECVESLPDTVEPKNNLCFS